MAVRGHRVGTCSWRRGNRLSMAVASKVVITATVSIIGSGTEGVKAGSVV